jgi:hypothetical protein
MAMNRAGRDLDQYESILFGVNWLATGLHLRMHWHQ